MNDAAVTAKTFRRQGAESMGLAELTVKLPFSGPRSPPRIVPHFQAGHHAISGV
jgi:hypothetical protein